MSDKLQFVECTLKIECPTSCRELRISLQAALLSRPAGKTTAVGAFLSVSSPNDKLKFVGHSLSESAVGLFAFDTLKSPDGLSLSAAFFPQNPQINAFSQQLRLACWSGPGPRRVGIAVAPHSDWFLYKGTIQVDQKRRFSMSKAKLVTGLFKTRVAAEAAVDAIIKRGYTRDEISVLMSDATKTKEFAVQTRTHAADGAGIGGAVGGAVGAAALAAIVALGAPIVLPGIVIAGPIVAALAGAGAGGATGGIIGALIGAGIPEHRAKVYDAGLRGGGILLGVESKSDEDADKLEQLLEDIGAEHVRQE
jgi:hypothetical protein